VRLNLTKLRLNLKTLFFENFSKKDDAKKNAKFGQKINFPKSDGDR